MLLFMEDNQRTSMPIDDVDNDDDDQCKRRDQEQTERRKDAN